MQFLRVKIHGSIVFLFQETFVILYWIGIWSFVDPTHRGYETRLLCLLTGLFGLLTLKAIEPKVILRVVDKSAEQFRASTPSIRNVERVVYRTLRIGQPRESSSCTNKKFNPKRNFA